MYCVSMVLCSASSSFLTGIWTCTAFVNLISIRIAFARPVFVTINSALTTLAVTLTLTTG